MKRVTLFVKVAASLLFIGVLLYSVDLGQVAECLRNVDGVYLGISVAFSFLMVAASTWKWWYLMRLQGFALPFSKMMRWYFIGYFYSNFLPSNVGGDVVRAWLAGKRTQASGVALVSVFAERFTGMIFLLLLAVVLPFFSPDLWRQPAVALGIFAGAAGLTGIALGCWIGQAGLRSAAARSLVAHVRRWVGADRPGRSQRVWTRVSDKSQRFSERLGALVAILRGRPAAFLAVVGLTALFYGLMIGNVVFAYRTFGVWPNAAGVACVLPVAVMVAMIPVTMGNLGIAEGAYVFYFGLVGMGRELTLAMSLLLRMKIIILGVVGLLAQAGETAGGMPRRNSSIGSMENE